jgi:hypothetical protein
MRALKREAAALACAKRAEALACAKPPIERTVLSTVYLFDPEFIQAYTLLNRQERKALAPVQHLDNVPYEVVIVDRASPLIGGLCRDCAAQPDDAKLTTLLGRSCQIKDTLDIPNMKARTLTFWMLLDG